MNISKINPSLTLDYIKNNKENSYFDRKSAKIDMKKLSNIIASFANANGGVVAFGVEDDGKITGINSYGENKVNEFQKLISNDYFKNIPTVLIEIINVNNFKVEKDRIILYHIEPSLNKIIRNAKDEVYLRQGDSSNKLNNVAVM